MNRHFVICIDNENYSVSLERRKLYEVIPDAAAEAMDQLRVKDESGDDCLYPSELFISVDLPDKAEKSVTSGEQRR